MTKDVVDAAIRNDNHESGLLRNYLDDETWFGEVAGTALMTSAVFRMAILEPELFGKREYTGWAEKKVEAVGRHVDKETGIAAPVVNPLEEGQRTPLEGINPEAQAFVVLMFTAWRDWKVATRQPMEH
ncbi:Six-hairpin glycosidase [Pyrenophora seminiperda CCB06]|uniref:Six-hairpin glycosidase n=1 Tax=Pyrenophora seminiperda CCB06 TaxID=1302712 RepID=A0A3M7LWJ6_9PLEO|nr:Six-hairpin glycosidase [Pyrenophora seminiperda CCB06]